MFEEKEKKVWNRRSSKKIEENKNNPYLEIFARNLKSFRDLKSLSMSQLELRSGVSVNVIYEIENKLLSPNYNTIIKLAKALDVHPSLMSLDPREYQVIIDMINDLYHLKKRL